MSATRNANQIQSRVRLAVLFSALFCFSILSTGCDSTTTVPSSKLTLLPADAEDSSGQNAPSITVAEAEAFADDWRQCIETGDSQASNDLISWVGMANRTLEPFKVSADFRKGFVNGALSKIGPSFVGQMKSIVDGEGSYRLVKVISRGGKRHVVFRMVDPNTGLNYHDFQLEKVDGKVRASHLFVAATGEEFAESLRSLVAPAIASSNSTFSRLTGEQQKQLKALDDLKALKDAVNSGQKAKALKICKSLPPKTQEMKLILLMKMQCLDIEEDEATYLATIDQYANLYPNDPSLGLITLDAAFLRKDTELLEQSRSLIQAWTGGDPYVDLIVGGLLINLEKVDEAVELTKDVDPEPLGVADAHDFKLTIALAIDDHPTVLKELLVLRDKFGFQLGDLKGAEGFEGFIESPEYSEWMGE